MRHAGCNTVPAPDGLSRAAAEAAWHAVTPLIAGTPHVRISRDGGRTYPARHARPLPAEPPGQPCTVPVYDPGSGTGRMLALDLDPARGDVDQPGAELGQLLERLGARYVADVSPTGGRHVLVLFAAPLPWLELRDARPRHGAAVPGDRPGADVLASAARSRRPAPVTSPAAGGCSRCRWSDARAAVEHPNGPEVWAALLTEFAAELRRSSNRRWRRDVSELAAELDDAGVPWVPRLGGRAPLGAELEQSARTGRWDRSRYAGRSEARMAVLGAAAARGWRLAEVRVGDRLRRLEGPSRAVRAALRARPA